MTAPENDAPSMSPGIIADPTKGGQSVERGRETSRNPLKSFGWGRGGRTPIHGVRVQNNVLTELGIGKHK